MHVELGNYMRLTRAGEWEWVRVSEGVGGWGEELPDNEIGILSISASECGVKDHRVLIGILATWLW